MTSLETTTAIKLIINTPKYYNKFRYIQKILIRITLPYIFIVAVVGFITNTATIVLLSKSFVTKNPRHKWTLIALALSDLVHNSALSVRVVHDITKEKIEYLCIIISFLSQLAELLSACYTVLFTIQRYRAVRYPLEAAVRYRSSPLVIILLIFLLSVLFCLILTHANAYIDCHEELKLGWFIADALLSFIIPFSLILIFNIRIVRLIQQHARSSITQQSIILRPQKRLLSDKNSKDDKGSRLDEYQSIVYSVGNSITLNGTISEADIENKNGSQTSSIKKKNNNHSKTPNDNQINDVAIPLIPVERANSDGCSTGSPRPSVKSQNSLTAKANSRRDSHQSIDLDLNPPKSSYISQSIRVTRMLVLVSTCFLILNAPAHLFVIAMKIYIGADVQVFGEHTELEQFQQTRNLTNNQIKKFVFIQTNQNQTMMESAHSTSYDVDIIDDNIIIHLFYMAIQITQWISYASYSVNFFLYSFSGITLRSTLRQFWNKLRRH